MSILQTGDVDSGLVEQFIISFARLQEKCVITEAAIADATVHARDEVLVKRGFNDSYLTVLQQWEKSVPATDKRIPENECVDVLGMWILFRTGG